MTMAAFAAWAKSDSIQVNEAIKWGTVRGWFRSKKDDAGKRIALTDEGLKRGLQDYLKAVEYAKTTEECFLDELPSLKVGIPISVDRVEVF